MSDKKISALTAATVAAGADELPVNEAGTTKKVTLDQIGAYLVASVAGKTGDVTLDEADIANLVDDLAGKAATAHAHAESDVTGLVADLAARQRVLARSTTALGTSADQLEKTLWTYDLPANTLNADGTGVRITVWCSVAANADIKTERLYFGATVLTTRGGSADNNLTMRFTADVLRTGASAQTAGAFAQMSNGAGNGGITTPAADTTAPITIKFTGQNGTAAANDIVFKQALVEFLG